MYDFFVNKALLQKNKYFAKSVQCVFFTQSPQKNPAKKRRREFLNTPENAKLLSMHFNALVAKFGGETKGTDFRRALRRWFVSQGIERFKCSKGGGDASRNLQAYKRARDLYVTFSSEGLNKEVCSYNMLCQHIVLTRFSPKLYMIF